MCFSDRSDTNRSVQLQKMARSLKFRILKVEELYYPQALCLCFCIGKNLVFSWRGSFNSLIFYSVIEMMSTVAAKLCQVMVTDSDIHVF